MSLPRLLLLALCALGFTACATTMQTYAPKASIPFEKTKILQFASDKPVTLINAQPSTELVDVLKLGQTQWQADRHVWTDVVIEVAGKELADHGMRVVPNSPKTLRLAVESVHSVAGFHNETQLVLSVTTADGYARSYTGINSSGGAAIFSRQWDGAIMRAVAEMLRDPKLVDYLQK